MTLIDRRPADAPSGTRVAIVAARFNNHVVSKLVDGAIAGLAKYGVMDDSTSLTWVPGAFELPLVAEHLAPSWDAVVCLGAVIRGETPHFDLVAGQAARGIREVGSRLGTPIIFGVLTTDTLEQALARAGGAHGNKGWDSAEAALEMVAVMTALKETE